MFFLRKLKMPEDFQFLRSHAGSLGTSVSAFMIQCETIVRAKLDAKSSPDEMAATVEQLLSQPLRATAPPTRKKDLANPGEWMMRADSAFFTFISSSCKNLSTLESLKQAEGQLCQLFHDYMDALDKAAVASSGTRRRFWIPRHRPR